MKTTEEMIDVMQAFADGKKIEYSIIGGGWYPASTPTWEWTRCDYRIKPREPRRVWVSANGFTYANKPKWPETTEFIEVMP